MKNEDKISALIKFLYLKNKLTNIINDNTIPILNKIEINKLLSKINNFDINDLSNENFENIKMFLNEELGKYKYLNMGYSIYAKISQKELFEHSIEGFYHNYEEGKINKGNLQNKDDIIKNCELEIKKHNKDKQKTDNLNDRIFKTKNTFRDKEPGLFFAINTDLFSFITYGTQITIAIEDMQINNDNIQINYQNNNFEFNFNQIYIAKNFDLCDENILASLIKTIESINKFNSGFYNTAIKELINNLSLYENSEKSIDLLEKLPEIIRQCNNKEDLINVLNQQYPESTKYDYIFNSEQFLNNYRKEIGINETIKQSQFKLIPKEFIEYISTSKDKNIKQFYRDFCNYFDYYPKEKNTRSCS